LESKINLLSLQRAMHEVINFTFSGVFSPIYSPKPSIDPSVLEEWPLTEKFFKTDGLSS
jgi:hypothetical protein